MVKSDFTRFLFFVLSKYQIFDNPLSELRFLCHLCNLKKVLDFRSVSKKEVKELLKQNFDRFYFGKRAHFGIYAHAKLFDKAPQVFEAYIE